MKVLFLGATGLLGKPVFENLDVNGFSLRLLSRSINKSDYQDRFETVKGDVLNEEILKKLTGYLVNRKSASSNGLMSKKPNITPEIN